MADPLLTYLESLENDLRGRLPASEVASILDESSSHLHDLATELGSMELAVAKFGSPRRCARKILREANPVPNPWRASVLPFALSLAFTAFLMLTPVGVFERLIWPVPYIGSWMAFIYVVATATIVLALARSRQFLLKPLFAFSTVIFAFCVFALQGHGTAVRASNGHEMIVGRDAAGLKGFSEAVQTQRKENLRNRDLLEQGIAFFKPGADPKKVPAQLRFYGGPMLNPATIVASLTLQDRSESWKSYFEPPALSRSDSAGGTDDSLVATIRSWQRDGPAALARVQSELDGYDEILQKAPAAAHSPLWKSLVGHFSRAALFTLRSVVALAYLNLYGWILSLIYVRVRLPRRRYA